MNSWIILILIALQADARPILSATLDAGPVPFVGQGIGVRLTASGFAERPRITAPRVPEVEILDAGIAGETRRFVLVPRRAGVLRIPPFAARSGEGSAASAPLEVRARARPPGEPATFLGGVGAIELVASVSEAMAPLGGSVEYRLTLGGPGALGSTRRPSIRWPEGLDAKPIAATPAAADPPSRLFAWTIRPARPVALVVPPAVVSVLEPATGLYVTYVSMSVRLDVIDVPPRDLGDAAEAPMAEPGTPWGWMAAAGATTVLGLAAAGVVASRRRRPDPSRLARRLSRSLPRSSGPAEGASLVADALSAYLGQAGGVLTPVEACRHFEAAEPRLADRVGDLVAACDRARYSGQLADGDALLAEARAVLDALGRVGRARSRRGGTE